MTPTNRLLAAALAIAIVASACSGAADETTTTTPPQTTTTTVPSTTTTTLDPNAGFKVGPGVDFDAKTIRIGYLADLTGPFAPLVSEVTDAQGVYWDTVNAGGGIDGWTVEVVIKDTNYREMQHLIVYEEIRDDVAALGQSAGSSTNSGALELYAEDDMLVLPLSWYSGWAFPEVDGGLLLESSANYCFEAMNMVDFVAENEGTTMAVVTLDNDFGHDIAAGTEIAAGHYGVSVVYDGAGAVSPGDDLTPAVQQLVDSQADWTLLGTNASLSAEIMALSAQLGYEGLFIGAQPSFDYRLLDSASAELFDTRFFHSVRSVPWGNDVPGNAAMMTALAEAFPDRRPSDAFIIGWNASVLLREVLEIAISSTDLSRFGLLAAAASLTEVDFGGSQPTETYVGIPDETAQRASAIVKPTLDVYQGAGGANQTLSSGNGSTGAVMVRDFTVGDAAASHVFTEPCYLDEG